MNFSVYQWILTFLLDFFLKVGLVYLVSGFSLALMPLSLMMSFALPLSIFHLLALSIASGLAEYFDVARARLRLF